MDTQPIRPYMVIDKEILEEFRESLSDLVPQIERDIALLKNAPNSPETIDNLFRAIHNIKGDAALCKVELAVTVVHPIETVLARVRRKEIGFTELLGEAMLLVLDRLELAVDDLFFGRSLENLYLQRLVDGFEKLANASNDEIDHYAAQTIQDVTGFRPAAAGLISSVPHHASSHFSHTKSGTQISEDLIFFRTLAEQFESHSPAYEGRTDRLLQLAADTNEIAGGLVDEDQLEAAVYMHDVGMMFLSESVWLKQGRMTEEERQALKIHPKLGAGLLSRMLGWEAAGQMVLQHHEMPDGQGYPLGIKSDQICDGAKILSIIDAFESIMLKHTSRGKNISLLRAIAEINACDTQFAPEWIEPFNQVIRRLVES